MKTDKLIDNGYIDSITIKNLELVPQKITIFKKRFPETLNLHIKNK